VLKFSSRLSGVPWESMIFDVHSCISKRSICFPINNVAFGHGVEIEMLQRWSLLFYQRKRVSALLGRNGLWCDFSRLSGRNLGDQKPRNSLCSWVASALRERTWCCICCGHLGKELSSGSRRWPVRNGPADSDYGSN
jgi:hypothetical protein